MLAVVYMWALLAATCYVVAKICDAVRVWLDGMP